MLIALRDKRVKETNLCSGRCSPTSVNVNLLLLRLRLDVVLGDSSAPQSH